MKQLASRHMESISLNSYLDNRQVVDAEVRLYEWALHDIT